MGKWNIRWACFQSKYLAGVFWKPSDLVKQDEDIPVPYTKSFKPSARMGFLSCTVPQGRACM